MTNLPGQIATNVFAATRDDGCVGYFWTRDEIPPEFKWPGIVDIAPQMKGYNTTDPHTALAHMNSHWRSLDNYRKKQLEVTIRDPGPVTIKD